MSFSEFTLESVERQFGLRTPVYGCVTTGETWQFLRLAERAAVLDRDRYYLDNVGGILEVLQAIYQDAVKAGNRAR